MKIVYTIVKYLVAMGTGGSIIFIIDYFAGWGIPDTFKSIWSTVTMILIYTFGALFNAGYGEEE